MRELRAIAISAVTALAVFGCSVEGNQTGTMIGGAQGGYAKTWESEFNEGKVKLASGYYGLALERFKAALDGNPRSARIMNALAVTYDRLGRHDLAELYYDKALAIDPNSAMTLNNVGYSMLTRERYEEALIYFEQALKHQQALADRRVTSANRKLALDRLRLARQQESQQAVAKASSAVTGGSGRIDCLSQGSAAVGRTGERVFELITSRSGKAEVPAQYRSGHSESAIASERTNAPCESIRHSRVALINTVGPEDRSRIALAGSNRNESRPDATIQAVIPERVQAIPVSKPQPVRAAIRDGHSMPAPQRDVKAADSAVVGMEPAARAPTKEHAARVEIAPSHAANVDPRPAAAAERPAQGPETSRASEVSAASPDKRAIENPLKEAAPTASSIGAPAQKPGDAAAAARPGVAADEPQRVAATRNPVGTPAGKPRSAAASTSAAGMIVEVSNGAGRNKLAARMRAYLESKGLPVAFLTNAESFRNRHTTIFYKRGNRSAAESFARHLPIAVQFVEVSGYFADIRIRLGTDILKFDSNTLYAAKVGGSNV